MTPPRPVPPGRRAGATILTPGRGRNTVNPTTASRSFLARATLITASLSVAGSVLGLVRDQSLARMFGAGGETDAFLVAWTVPEFAATLLVEDGLAFVLIPAFSSALALRAQGVAGDPVRSLAAATFPRMCLGLVAVSAVIAAGAPHVVRILAPGLTDAALAVDCTRVTATCVLTFGIAGYCSAVLRAHRRFLPPATIYVAYNVGIITTMLLLGRTLGVRAAAVGVAVGGCLMAAIQLPYVVRQLRARQSVADGWMVARPKARPVPLALISTVLLFALCRQSQVLIERFLASTLPSGAISGLNYAQKVAQIPMTLSLMLCTVTFPVVARALADGDVQRARTRIERDLALASCLLLLGAAVVISCAPQIVKLLFERGAFTPRDTAVTADILRVYAVGLLGQTVVGVLIRSYFSTGRPTWYPIGAMATGLLATFLIGAGTADSWGAPGIAAANAIGITLTAALLLTGLGSEPTFAVRFARRSRSRGVPIRVPQMLGELGRLALAAAAATAGGLFAGSAPASPAGGLTAGGVTVITVFLLIGRLLHAQGCTALLRSARSLTRRLTHGHSD
ncbi:MATE family efflux transporter [Streptomyces cellulosae]|nr:MATE family efflux transporter [Streptomyces cellulosae]